ncbi:MAG: YihY/virulence factor BrkB family protein [Bacteroidia bacterium]
MTNKKFSIKDVWPILKETFKSWNEHEPWRNSAIIAYYAIFSLPGLLVIVVNLAGALFGEQAVRGEITAQVGELIDQKTAQEVENMIAQSRLSDQSLLMTILGIATIIFGATGVFYQLQQSLNLIWEVKPNPKRAWVKYLKDRLFGFGIILVVGFLLLISLVLSALLSALSKWIMTFVPDYTVYLFKIVDFIISFGLITVLFAMMFKYLPDAELKWRDVWIGAAVTTFLFQVGKYGLSLYFANSDPASAYGAASSIILLMVWISYSCLILFFGVEFTKAEAVRYGHYIPPSEYAEKDEKIEYRTDQISG